MRDKKRTNRLAEITRLHKMQIECCKNKGVWINPNKYINWEIPEYSVENLEKISNEDLGAELFYAKESNYLKSVLTVYNEEFAEWQSKLEDTQRYVASLESEIASLTARIKEVEALGEKQ